ncbi:hypothetical protein IAR55_003024 [Kwoniella newhampshirensis]|uniref:GST N-terminal domain-containing protein n=1 Tax=Kwoniella newhampshirensis TaxID=1651941 RepID=A0AAW0YZN3_9TREE
MSFAPHGWKAVLPLRALGVPYTTVFITLHELREILPKELGLPKVTVPALEIRRAGEATQILLDSYNISQYLEANHGTSDRSIYAGTGEVGRHFSRFVEQWVDRSLAAAIRPCVLHTSYACFPAEGPNADVASRKAFLAKCGQSKMNEMTALNSDPDWTMLQYAAIRQELGTIEILLSERHERGESGVFLGGGKPIHADFCVFAFYPYSRTNRQLVEQTWHHESLPYVGKWLQAMQTQGLVSETELLPL